MQTSVRVEVLGRPFTLTVKEENVERIREVARRVNGRMEAFQRRHPGQAELTTAIITALAIAEDLHDERRARQEDADALSGDLKTLTATLTGALATEEDGPRENGAGTNHDGTATSDGN